MQSTKHLKSVDLPPFIYTASDRDLDDTIELMEALTQVYRAEITRIILDVCVIAIFVILLCAFK